MKRIIFCFDGTWNRIDAEHPTNVLLMASAVAPVTKDGVTQIVHYDNGVGTSLRDKLSGGITGYGLFENIQQAYQFLIFNYDPGDEIYCFGFSRGAFTARSFIGLIRSVGILERHHAKRISEAADLYKSNAQPDVPELSDFRTRYSSQITVCKEDEELRCLNPIYTPGSSTPFRIRYVGLWDTVESLGLQKIIWPWLPFVGKKRFVGGGHEFHNHNIDGMITAGRHAVALDERRRNFDIEPWGTPNHRDVEYFNEKLGYDAEDFDRPFQEMFFPGVHGSVGGGGRHKGLSDGALEWIQSGAEDHGLELQSTKTSTAHICRPYAAAPLNNKHGKKSGVMDKLPGRWRSHKPKTLLNVHKSAQARWAYSGNLPEGTDYRPQTLYHITSDLAALPAEIGHIEAYDDTGKTEALQRPKGIASRYHVLEKGETLSSFAKRDFYDTGQVNRILDINRDLIPKNSKVYPGLIIRIPIVDPQKTL